MSAAHGQLPLSTPVDILKKSCICLFGPKRCTKKRYHAGSEARYDDLLDDMTLRRNDLNTGEQAIAAQKLAEFSVCGTCLKECRHYDVQAEFLRERAAALAVSPPRQQRSTSPATLDGASPGLPTPSRYLRIGSPPVLVGGSSVAGDLAKDDTADAASSQDGVLSVTRTTAGTYASSQTFGPTPHARSPSPSTSSAVAGPALAVLRRQLFPSSNCSSLEPPAGRYFPPLASTKSSTVSQDSSRASRPASKSDDGDTLPAVSEPSRSTEPERLPAGRVNAALLARQDRRSIREWLNAHIREVILFNVGGMFWALLMLATFVVWAANHA